MHAMAVTRTSQRQREEKRDFFFWKFIGSRALKYFDM